MQLEVLRLYCDVVRLRSYSRGARQNHISQSAASQSIRKLEGELGVALIDRTQRPLMATPEGKAFYVSCLGLLDSWEKAKASFGGAKARVDGVVRVAAIYSVGVHDVSRYMQHFMSAYPEARVELECLHPPEVVEAVLSGAADVGIMSYPPSDRGLTVVHLPAEPMALVCHPDHRLARRKTIRPADLNGEAFVAFDAELMIRKAIDRTLRHHEVRVKVVMELDNIETIKQAITVAAGVSILPRPTVAHEAQLGTLVVVPISIRELVRPVGIIHRRHQSVTPTVDRFIQFVQEEAERLKPKLR